MTSKERRAGLCRERLRAGKCGNCGQYPVRPGRKSCDVCLERWRQKSHTYYYAGLGKGQGAAGVKQANGRKAAERYRARATGTVILPKPIYPRDSWWACSTREQFMAREAAEQHRMKVSMLPKAVTKVLDEVFGERDRW